MAPSDPAGGEDTALGRFRRSMVIDQERWRDGIGYDLAALAEAGPGERRTIEALLVDHRPRDWRDVEALARLDTAVARAALEDCMKDPNPEIRLAVTRYAPGLVAEKRRRASLVRALGTAAPFAGLWQALDEAEAFHPPAVIGALFRGVLDREGEVAAHFAGLLLHLYGRAESAFDEAHRTFLLRFATEDADEREAALRELCKRVSVDADPILRRWRARRRRRSHRDGQARA